MASPLKLCAVALTAGIRSAQVTGDIESQRLTDCGGARKEEENRGHVKVVSESGCQDHATVAHAVYLTAPDQVGGDILVKNRGEDENA